MVRKEACSEKKIQQPLENKEEVKVHITVKGQGGNNFWEKKSLQAQLFGNEERTLPGKETL